MERRVKRGRPKLPKSDRKVVIAAAVKVGLKNRLERQAESEGMTLSEWIGKVLDRLVWEV